jgi:hypothetical protein
VPQVHVCFRREGDVSVAKAVTAAAMAAAAAAHPSAANGAAGAICMPLYNCRNVD